MRILLVDCPSSANRGHAATLDATLEGLRARGVRVDVAAERPDITRVFHDVDAIDVRDTTRLPLAIGRADLVVAAGGPLDPQADDRRLHRRLAALHLARRLGKPYALFGVGVPALVDPLARLAVREVLDGAVWICTRDAASARRLLDMGVRAPLRIGVDPAVLAGRTPAARGHGAVLGVSIREGVAIPSVNPAQGQADFETGLAEALDAWAEATGGTVRFFAACTPFAAHPEDDRVPARRVAAQMRADAEVVEALDLDFRTFRGEVAACDVFVGSRLLPLLAATTAGVPSLALSLDDKVLRYMEQVAQADAVASPLQPERFLELVARLWAGRAERVPTLVRMAERLRLSAEDDLDSLVRVGSGERPARSLPERRPKPGWDGETWRYDHPHRRLRVIAELLLGGRPGEVLDLGSSTGRLGRMLGPAFRYTGVDIAPSVAVESPGFRVVTGDLRTYQPARRYDAVVVSGALEFVDDVPAFARTLRSALSEHGTAILSFPNLAHVARALGIDPRHPDHCLSAGPDDIVMALAEAGLQPERIFAPTAGYGPEPALTDDHPGDHALDGGATLSLDRLVRLGHEWIVVCRAADAAPGPAALTAAFQREDHAEALRIGHTLIRAFPWAARAWSDLGVVWNAVGRNDKAVHALQRAWRLDPGRTDVTANLCTMGTPPVAIDPETAVLADPHDDRALDALIDSLAAAGAVHGAQALRGIRRERAMGVAAK